jgi:hypothetical protein
MHRKKSALLHAPKRRFLHETHGETSHSDRRENLKSYIRFNTLTTNDGPVRW